MPYDIFPVQQKLVLDQTYGSQDCIYVHLGEGLLKPECFAAGFLIHIQSLLPSADDCTVQPMNLFSFFSAPSFLDGDPVTAAEICLVLAENLAAPKHISLHTNSNPFRRCWPQMRDLVPGRWTAIVSLESTAPLGPCDPHINATVSDTRLFVRASSV